VVVNLKRFGKILAGIPEVPSLGTSILGDTAAGSQHGLTRESQRGRGVPPAVHIDAFFGDTELILETLDGVL
jgi:hypothetical protein